MITLIKKSYFLLVLSLFLIPGVVLAADLTFSEDTTINLSIGGTSTDFTIISGSTADEITTETSALTFKISGGQTFTLRSADRKILDNDGGLSQNCPSAYSEISITLPSGSGARTIKVTPSSSNCSTLVGGGGGGSGGGGGGGGGGVSTSSATPTPTPTPATGTAAIASQIAALQAQIAGLSGQTVSTFQFTKNLTIGSSGEDVKALQKFLNAAGFKIANSGPGSPGNETSLFGSLTRTALAKWQAANAVSPASGYFGPLTRAKITSVSVPVATPLATPLVTPVQTPPTSGTAFNFTRSLTLGSRGTDVKALQDYLTSTGHYKYSGGSTGIFGPVTQTAVAAWQKANDLSPAVGYFGSLSKAKYLELINK
ncbi:MAG: DNA topoisomerase IV subunit A [Parcubacteria group bacterium Gr01-1014_2]|nr:MAG: DNA topoisomerase IV subunit A [Parcubacteria group bacterium Gr01-1014_2]